MCGEGERCGCGEGERCGCGEGERCGCGEGEVWMCGEGYGCMVRVRGVDVWFGCGVNVW